MIAAAVNSASEASALIRAGSEAMLDPQVLLEAVWEDGRVTNLVSQVVILVDDDGTMTWISKSIEQVLGDTADHWLGKPVYAYGPIDLREANIARWNQIVAAGTYIGRITVYSADGTRHTAHMHSKPFFDADGVRKGIVASIRIIDDEIAAEIEAREQIGARDERNDVLAHALREKASRFQSQLDSAARYVRSILPKDLDGPVAVTARYLPSAGLSGDSYDFRWLDDDHLVVYLVDVSGHGVEPALLSVSVHNVLRSGSIERGTLLQPDAVLTALNRLFQMDQQGGLYFTIWYGVYQASTRTLRFASAGHPPALVITQGTAPEQFSTKSIPIGVDEAADFKTRDYTVPAGADIVLYSDGALESSDGRELSPAELGEICAATAGRSDWTLDTLIAALPSQSDSRVSDDCTVVRLRVS